MGTTTLFIVALVVCFCSCLQNKAAVQALEDYQDQISDFTFIYHDYSKLLLTLHRDSCYFTAVDAHTVDKLSDSEAKQRIHAGVVNIIEDSGRLGQDYVNQASLTDMLNLYQDRLADFHCLDKHVHELTLSGIFTDPVQKPFDCSDVQKYEATSGVRTLYVGNTFFNAFCDQTTDGGGWTVLVNRKDGSGNFNQKWAEYAEGFGDVAKEYWLGLEHMHALTSNRSYEMRVDMTDHDGDSKYALYGEFLVDDASRKYQLHARNYSGDAGDGLYQVLGGPHNHVEDKMVANGMPFSTSDSDHDNSHEHCAEKHHNGWWHNDCTAVGITGLYHSDGHNHHDQGMIWKPWHHEEALKAMAMKIRPQ